MVADTIWILIFIGFIVYEIYSDAKAKELDRNFENSDISVQWGLENAVLNPMGIPIDLVWERELGHKFFPRDGFNTWQEVHMKYKTINSRKMYYMNEIEQDMNKLGKKYDKERSMFNR